MGSRRTQDWSPTELGGALTAWYRADTANVTIATGVSQWNDLSGHGYHLKQSTGANQPTLVVGGINGKNYISFDGSDDYLGTDALVWNQPMEYIMALSWPDATLHRYLFGGNAAGLDYMALYDPVGGDPTLVGMYSPSPGPALTGVLNSGWVILHTVWNGASSYIYKNNTTSSGPGNVGTQNTTNFYFGTGSPWYFTTDVLVAEIVVVSGSLSATNRALITQYMGNRYGITVTGPSTTGKSQRRTYSVWTPKGMPGLMGWYEATKYQAVETDYVADGDMEAVGTASWIADMCSVSKVGSPHSGTQCLKIERSSYAVGYAEQPCGGSGKRFAIHGWARGDGTAIPAIKIGGGANPFGWTGTSSTDWQEFSFSQTDVDTYLYLAGTNMVGAGNYVNFDDITVVGQNVSQLTDLSGNGYHLTQSTSSRRPVINTNTFNSKPAIAFDGNAGGYGDYLESTALGAVVATGTDQPFTVIMAFNKISAFTDRAMWGFGSAGIEYHLLYDTAAQYVSYRQRSGETSVLLSGTNPGLTRHVTSMVYTGTAVSIIQDGVYTSLNNTPQDTASMVTSTFTLGCFRGGSYSSFANMQVAGLLIFNRALNDNERLACEAYLRTTCGV